MRRVGKDPLDAQTSARLLKRAQTIKGSREDLAQALGVRAEDLAAWMQARSFPPEPIFEKVVDIILGEHRGKDESPAAGKRAPQVLVAESRDGFAVLSRILGGEFTLVPVHTLVDGLDLLQSGAVQKQHAFDAVICGQHFEGSQMLRFLECVKAYKPTSAIPFICCRATETQLRSTALAATREACEALGAVAYIDLPGLERDAGAERAAVEFRDAVRAAVRLRSAQSSLRILVVDDNPDAAHTLTALLRMAGHETFKAAGGEEALRIGAREEPDVALLDIGMAGMSGYELAGRIRSQPWGRRAVLIAVTGWGRPEDRDRSREAGFDHHFTKPVILERLLEVLPKK